MRARLHFTARRFPLSPAELTRALADAGIEPLPADTDGDLPDLIVFDAFDTVLCERIRQLGGEGARRILAVGATPPPSLDSLWQLTQAGACEVLCWETSPHPEAAIAARLERWALVDELVASPPVADVLVGRDPAWQAVVRRLVELARCGDSAILILGESGTGKELAARLVHALDPRPRKTGLVVVDCATIVPELSGSEFFGHERGAFTHALQAREGALELADNGTLLLDEVGELPLPLQGQLLRAVQERSYKRVGGNVWRSADFRLVCATNRDLHADAEHGRFRPDLYYRISTSVVRLPPLRDRRRDIPALAEHFIRTLHPEVCPPYLDAPVRDYLLSRAYPGNVRELRQLLTRMLHRHVGSGPVTVGDIPEDDRPAPAGPGGWRDSAFEDAIRRALAAGAGLKDIGRAAEDEAIRIAVLDEDGNLQRAAHRLGVTDRALQLRRAQQRVRT